MIPVQPGIFIADMGLDRGLKLFASHYWTLCRQLANHPTEQAKHHSERD
jgi:hypothetical protein